MQFIIRLYIKNVLSGWQRNSIICSSLASGLIFFSVLASVYVMLPNCICGVLDESLGVRSKTTASGARSDGTRITVHFSPCIWFFEGGNVDGFQKTGWVVK